MMERNDQQKHTGIIHITTFMFQKYLFERRIIGKIRKTFFSGVVIFGGQNPKNEKKIQKILLSQIVR